VDKRHEGRVAVISGAAGGIGQAHAERLAQEGAKIVIADIADGAETVELVKKAGSDAVVVRCDITSGEEVASMAREAVDAFGKVDILVHNAGIFPAVPFADTSFELWRRILAVNLDGGFHLCRAFLPGMRERKWGRIVFMVSTTFHTGAPMLSAYTASKGGLIGLLRSLASEIGEDGVTINGIAPGVVRTDAAVEAMKGAPGYFEQLAQQQAIKRTELPEDLVGSMSFLVSDDAAFVTGQTLCVDGGWVRA
jgi:NAD(P)-dependent dehydrogenase (short-subunit alcohol dehydrogenase family)